MLLTISTLRKAIEAIKYEFRMNQGEIANKLGYKIPYLSDVINERKPISEQFTARLIEAFPGMNTDWLLTGEGEIFTNSHKLAKLETSNMTSSQLARIESHLVPLYDLGMAASFSDLLVRDVHKPVDFIYIPNLSPCDGAVYVRGDAMSPYLQAGDVVLFKKVKTQRIIDGSGIAWGEIYLVLFALDGEEYVVLKYVRKSSSDELVTLANYNPAIRSQDIPLGSIKALALVKAGIKYTTMY